MGFLDVFMSIGEVIVESLSKLVPEVLKSVATIFINIGKALGLIDKGTDAEDLGDKVLQAEEQGKKPEDYDSFEEFVNSLDDFEVDPVKSKELSAEEKLTKGVEVVAQLLAEKYEGLDVKDILDCGVKNVEYLTPDRVKELGKLIQTDVGTVNDVIKYLNGTELNDAKLAKDESILVRIEKTINPSISDADALRTVRSALLNAQK